MSKLRLVSIEHCRRGVMRCYQHASLGVLEVITMYERGASQEQPREGSADVVYLLWSDRERSRRTPLWSGDIFAGTHLDGPASSRPPQPPSQAPRRNSASTLRVGYLPTAVADDPAVPPELLVILAYGTTIGGDFAPQSKELAGLATKGVDGDIARRAIELGRELGYVQPGEKSIHLHLPGGDGRRVERAWFDGSMTLKQLAALLYLRAIATEGERVYARELLEERFGWSREIVAKVMRQLLHGGLLRKHSLRYRGHYVGVVYSLAAGMPASSPAASPESTAYRRPEAPSGPSEEGASLPPSLHGLARLILTGILFDNILP